MARKGRNEATASEGEKLYTLSEISKRIGISMPTAQRYKKLYQDRIPSVGKGRKQRYPAEALPVFEQVKEENVGRRGRPRKSESAAAGSRRTPPAKKGVTAAKRGRQAKVAAEAPAAEGSGLLTLTEISERTAISYPTLVRYVKLHGDRIPSEGKGRRRRYYPEAVEIFQSLRAESPRGGGRKPAGGKAKPKSQRARGQKAAAGRRTAASAAAAPAEVAGISAELEKRLASLEKSLGKVEQKLSSLVAKLQKPRKLI